MIEDMTQKELDSVKVGSCVSFRCDEPRVNDDGFVQRIAQLPNGTEFLIDWADGTISRESIRSMLSETMLLIAVELKETK